MDALKYTKPRTLPTITKNKYFIAEHTADGCRRCRLVVFVSFWISQSL